MILKIKQSILKKISHWLFPYLQDEVLKKEKEQHEFLRTQFSSCGNSFVIGEDLQLDGSKYMTIGDSFFCGKHNRLQCIDSYAGVDFYPNLTIGDNVSMEDSCHIGCVDNITIGSGTMIASKVFITDHFHGCIGSEDLTMSPRNRALSHQPVSIGENVWIGDGVCIMPGVVLGNNVIVGANAVVTHSFPDGCVVAGVPARLIKQL